MATVRTGRFDEIPDLHFPAFVHKDRHGDTALRRIVHLMAEETGADAYLRQQKAIMARPDARPLLASIACPTLVLVGDGDDSTPPHLSQEIAAAIPGAQLVVVPDCGHLSTLERPDAVKAALVAWLAPPHLRGRSPCCSNDQQTRSQREQSVGVMIDRVGWMVVQVTPSVDDRSLLVFLHGGALR
jgi:ADP-ribose pyrophosphatase YjhB (NUDIX family)